MAAAGGSNPLHAVAPCVGARIRPPRNRRLATVTFAPLHPAGIRADGLTRFAFPSADGRQWHRSACADIRSAGRLPLAGTAQVGRMVAFPVSRLTAYERLRADAAPDAVHTIAQRWPSPGGGRICILGRFVSNPQMLVSPTLLNAPDDTDCQKAQLDTTLLVISITEDSDDYFEAPRVEIGIRPAELND